VIEVFHTIDTPSKRIRIQRVFTQPRGAQYPTKNAPRGQTPIIPKPLE